MTGPDLTRRYKTLRIGSPLKGWDVFFWLLSVLFFLLVSAESLRFLITIYTACGLGGRACAYARSQEVREEYEQESERWSVPLSEHKSGFFYASTAHVMSPLLVDTWPWFKLNNTDKKQQPEENKQTKSTNEIIQPWKD